MTRHTTVATAFGEVTLVADDHGLTGLYFPQHWRRPTPDSFGEAVTAKDDPVFAAAERQLGEYLAGERTSFDLPLAARGSAFQKRVWSLLDEVPYGETTTYGALASRLGDKALAQTVGQAVGRNPLCVIVPCHRVVGSTGRLIGYAGGLKLKRTLLELEEPAETAAAKLF